MSGSAFHPEAFADLDEIWEHIAEDNLDAADQVIADVHTVLRTLGQFSLDFQFLDGAAHR